MIFFEKVHSFFLQKRVNSEKHIKLAVNNG